MADTVAVADPQDKVELTSISPRSAGERPAKAASTPRAFLSIWFQCCHTYGRMYRNREQTRYEGRCPKCGGRVHAVIGPGGTNQRVFRAE